MNKTAWLTLLAIMPAVAQEAKFEIADVHVSPTPEVLVQYSPNQGAILRDRLWIDRDATVLNLIEEAYGSTEDGIAGGPAWLKLDLYDVVARTPAGATAESVRPMLQALLAERFKLVINKGMHPMPRYVLSVSKGGSKLKPSSGPGDSGCKGAPRQGPPEPGKPPVNKAICHDMTAKQIVEFLQQIGNYYLTHDIVDQTGLQGSFDFELEWTPAMQYRAMGEQAGSGISIFDAVSRQLGLELDLKKVPVETLGVESINRRPEPNPPGVSTSLNLAAARFEVATVKPMTGPHPGMGLRYTGGTQVQAYGTLRDLVGMALRITPNNENDMVYGLPKSADTAFWEVTGKLPTSGEGSPHAVRGRPIAPPISVAWEMLRGVLVDQFELKSHSENREITVYALTVDNGKPKLQRGDDSERSHCGPDPLAPRPYQNLGTMVTCRNTSMAEYADMLNTANGYLDHPVVDATGLEGGWNFTLGWTPLRVARPNAPGGAGAAGEASDPNEISIFQALEKEIGMKLVKQKRSVPVTVVDHVLEAPKE